MLIMSAGGVVRTHQPPNKDGSDLVWKETDVSEGVGLFRMFFSPFGLSCWSDCRRSDVSALTPTHPP